jgi:hypothetical protein
MNIELLFLPNNQNMGHYRFIHMVFNYNGKCSLEHMAHCPMNFLDNLEPKSLLWIIMNKN